MKSFRLVRFCFVLLMVPCVIVAQDVDRDGITMGSFVLRPSTRGLLAYDDRVRYNQADQTALSDTYAELSVGATLNNLPAAIDLMARINYGYRFYNEYDELNDDFYSVGASVASRESALSGGISADVTKSLSYNTSYDPDTGEGPDSILTDDPNTRWLVRGDVQYRLPISERTALVPGYSLEHYYQEFENAGSSEWQIHNVRLVMNHALTERTSLLVGGFFTLQTNDDEEGTVFILGGGAEGRLSDKTSWRVLGGAGYVDYELSGSDQSGLLDLNVQWQATEKISTYLFYGNRYEPGYGGGAARLQYRAGYGARWAFATRWSLGAQVLHDYSQGINSEPDEENVYGSVRHFISSDLTWNLTRRFSASLRARFVNDEEPVNRTVVSLSVGYVF